MTHPQPEERTLAQRRKGAEKKRAFWKINKKPRKLGEGIAAVQSTDSLSSLCVYAWNQETFGPDGTLGRLGPRAVVLTRDLRAAIIRLNPELPEKAVADAIEQLTRQDFSRSMLQHNQTLYGYIRNGVPVSYRDEKGYKRQALVRVIDFVSPCWPRCASCWPR